MPIFAPDGGPVLVLARGFAVVFLLSAFGTLVFRLVVVPRAFGRMTADGAALIEQWLLRCTRASLVLAGLGLCAWGAAVTTYLAGPQAFGAWLGSVAEVLADTSFGHVLSLQLALVVATGAALWRKPGGPRLGVALACATAAVLVQVGHGHAYAMAKGVNYLEISEALHLWAAGAWLGGLLPLLLVTWLAPPRAAAMAARKFSPMGKLCVVLLAGSAGVQAWVLVATTTALLHTAYGWTALLKLALFGVLLGFAALNRYEFAPALLGPDPGAGRRRLLGSLALQAGFGLLVVLAAALLSQLRPGMDMSMRG